MEQLVCILVWFGFWIMGLLLSGFVHIAIPVYLANKIIKILFPNLPIVSIGDAGWQHNVVFIGLIISLIIPSFHLFYYLNMEGYLFLQIPTWAPWVPYRTYELYHEFSSITFIAAFVSQFTIRPYSNIKSQKKKVNNMR